MNLQGILTEWRWRARLRAESEGMSDYVGYLQRRTQPTFLAALCGMALAGLLTAGCSEPETIGRYRAAPVTNIILDDLGVVDEQPAVFAEARQPLPSDLVVSESEYVIVPGDVLELSIWELIASGQEFVLRRQVSETGRVTLPEVGTFRAAGLTELELTQKISGLLSPAIIKEPTVSVTVVLGTERVFSISGLVSAPGPYILNKTDYRVMDAFAQAGGVPQQSVDYAYVIRNVAPEAYAYGLEAAGGPEGDGFDEIMPGGAVPGPDLAPLTPSRPARPPQDSQQELLESITPMAAAVYPVHVAQASVGQLDEPGQLDPTSELSQQDAAPAVPAVGLDPSQQKPLKIIRRADQFLAVPSGEPAGVPGELAPYAEPLPVAPPGADVPLPADLDLSQEVIQIDIKKLLGGDVAQNIVIRPGDHIRVPVNATGFYSVAGQIAKPGVYALQGEKLTLKQAIHGAGPMTPLAWTSRCEITRRISENKEVTCRVNLQKLFDGTAPNLYIKPHDIINVGSHPVARWLAVIRQSFRSTYGFGFVYDRNFADKDFGH